MKKIVFVFISFCLAGELEVDGDLKVTGTIQASTIDSLLSLIAQLEMRIAQLECQNTEIIPDGYCDCFFHTLDECGVCNGDTTSCQDCAGIPNGDNLQDMCGYCDNNPSNDCVQDCSGEWGGSAEVDVCGDCGGDAISEEECGFCTDIDGNIYATVQIGTQLWMAENLKVTKYRDGSAIPNITTNGDWVGLSTAAYGDYDNNSTNSETYGRLYNWYAVDDDRGVCPEGWHVSSDAEYTILTDYLGGGLVAGGKMKEEGTEHWNSPNTGATNESGFTSLPAGHRVFDHGNYADMGNGCHFWSSSESGNLAWYWVMNYVSSYIGRDDTVKQYGFSIRCLED